MGKLLYIIISIVILSLPVKDGSSYAYASKNSAGTFANIKFYVDGTEEASFSFIEVDEDYFQWTLALFLLLKFDQPLRTIVYPQIVRSLTINSLILFESDVSPPGLNV
jgi:hypothetical protein